MERDEPGVMSLEPPARLDAGHELFQLGVSCMIGRSAPVDLISAHKWFNVAAMLGHREAIRLRSEIAAEMSSTEITAAQRAARAWITHH